MPLYIVPVAAIYSAGIVDYHLHTGTIQGPLRTVPSALARATTLVWKCKNHSGTIVDVKIILIFPDKGEGGGIFCVVFGVFY